MSVTIGPLSASYWYNNLRARVIATILFLMNDLKYRIKLDLEGDKNITLEYIDFDDKGNVVIYVPEYTSDCDDVLLQSDDFTLLDLINVLEIINQESPIKHELEGSDTKTFTEADLIKEVTNE